MRFNVYQAITPLGLPFLLVMSPEAENLRHLFFGEHLIDEAVLDVDSP